MDIKKLGNSVLIFTIKRVIEIFGIIIFSIVRQSMEKKINQLVEEQKKTKRKK